MLRTDYCIRVSVNAFYIVSLHLLLAFIMCIFMQRNIVFLSAVRTL